MPLRPCIGVGRRGAPPTRTVSAMSTTDEFVTSAATYQADFDQGDPPIPPGRQVAVVACMDARLTPYGLLGLAEGDAHVLRNAGGVGSEDELRSRAMRQRLLGTEEIVLIHHTDCGMLTFRDDEFKAQIESDTGMRPRWSPEAFGDPEADVRQSLARVKADPFLPHGTVVRGFVYDVAD